MSSPLLTVSNLRVSAGRRGAELVRGVDIELDAGERLGIIGESGSGKSLTAFAIAGLTPLRVRGGIDFSGRRIGFVFQEPMTALDPLMRAGKQVDEITRSRARTAELFDEVGLEPRHLSAFPHELSGGQRQRVLIALALADDPELLICDEPTTALDATVAAHIIALINRIVENRNTALIFITHDLSLLSQVTRQVIVMKEGEVVERGDVDKLHHPYSVELRRATSLPRFPAPPQGSSQVIKLIDVHRTYSSHTALKGVSLSVPQGARLGIVGGSGSGKTTLLNILAGLDAADSGTVQVSGRVQMVFQDPNSSLNPRRRIGRSVVEPIDAAHEATALVSQIGLPEAVVDRYPHEFSGGQRQRLCIARAISCDPDIVLADEAVSALDVTVRRRILELLHHVCLDKTLVFVSHDLAVIRSLCTHVVVMNEGAVVEAGEIDQVWQHPEHDYTRRLLKAVT